MFLRVILDSLVFYAASFHLLFFIFKRSRVDEFLKLKILYKILKISLEPHASTSANEKTS